jgi:hypothetical protein
MQHCAQCGAPITGHGFRREIYAGSSIRTTSGRRGISFSRTTRSAVRTVCPSCAQQIDHWRRVKAVCALLGVAAFAILVMTSGGQQSDNQIGTRSPAPTTPTLANTSSPTQAQPQAALPSMQAQRAQTSQPDGSDDSSTVTPTNNGSPDSFSLVPLPETRAECRLWARRLLPRIGVLTHRLPAR